MPSKTKADPTREVPSVSLDHLCAIRIDGEHAEDFLQRQTMNDVRALGQPGDAQWSGVLSAKGRLLHLFRLVRTQGGFAVILPARDGDGLSHELMKFRFRSKVEFSRSEHAPCGLWSSAGDAAWDRARSLILDPIPNGLGPSVDDSALRDWMFDDWRSGILWIDDTARDRFTPQMLGLHRLHAFSLKKGCYPGQEIVARTHYLGKGKRELVRVEAEAPLRPGDGVLRDDAPIGEVLGVLDCDATKAFAVLSVTAGERQSDTLVTASGVALRMLDLAVEDAG